MWRDEFFFKEVEDVYYRNHLIFVLSMLNDFRAVLNIQNIAHLIYSPYIQHLLSNCSSNLPQSSVYCRMFSFLKKYFF